MSLTSKHHHQDYPRKQERPFILSCTGTVPGRYEKRNAYCSSPREVEIVQKCPISFFILSARVLHSMMKCTLLILRMLKKIRTTNNTRLKDPRNDFPAWTIGFSLCFNYSFVTFIRRGSLLFDLGLDYSTFFLSHFCAYLIRYNHVGTECVTIRILWG